MRHSVKDVVLRLAAMQLLISAGRFGGARLLSDGDRIRVGGETFGGRSAMTALIAARAADFQLPSGRFDMVQLFAITESECEFAAAHGAEALLDALRAHTTYPISDIARLPVV